MEELVLIINDLDEIVLNMGIFSIILSILLIIVESFIPILPLFLFISFNMIKLGNIMGFIFSYIASIIGSYLAFLFVRLKISKYLENKFANIHKQINKLSFINLTMILSLPYAPSSVINFAVGIGNIEKKKYLISLIIAKFFVVLFWGFMGVSLIDGIKDIRIIITLSLILIVVYLICKKVEKIIERRN